MTGNITHISFWNTSEDMLQKAGSVNGHPSHTMKMSHSDSCLDVVRTSGACKMSELFSQHRELLFLVAVTCFRSVPLVCHSSFCNPHYMVSVCVFLLVAGNHSTSGFTTFIGDFKFVYKSKSKFSFH